VPEPNDDRISSLDELASATHAPTRILVAGPDRWWTASLVSVLAARNFEVVTTTSSREALRHTGPLAPHAVIVHNRLTDGTGTDLVRNLRMGGFGEEYPIVICSDEHLGREERLEAIRAGAWDFLDLPLGCDEFLLKLDRFVGAARVARRVHDEFIDPVTGLYTLRGLLRCAQEMVSYAKRNHRTFGCVALAPAAGMSPTSEPGSHGSAVDPAPRIAALLEIQGRKSDVFGRIGPDEYVVLTPDTGPEGVVTAATRLLQGMAATPTTLTEDPRLMFRAGCFAVSDLADHLVDPADVISRATHALHQGFESDLETGTFLVGSVHQPS
jgi:PleD family two-component response regulator